MDFYSLHPKSRIRRNSMQISDLTFSTRNTLPCFALRSIGLSLSPCFLASLPLVFTSSADDHAFRVCLPL